MTTNVSAVLHEMQFLRDASGELIEQLAAVAQVADFESGAVIFRQGEEASTLHLVVTGRASLEICAPGVGCKRILTVGPGELLGWSPIVQEQSRLTATARALSATQTIHFQGPQLLAICDRNPRFGYEFMKAAALAIARRLNATRMQLLDVYGTQMPSAPLV